MRGFCKDHAYSPTTSSPRYFIAAGDGGITLMVRSDAAWQECCARLAQQFRPSSFVTSVSESWRSGLRLGMGTKFAGNLPAFPRSFSQSVWQMADNLQPERVKQRLQRRLLLRVTLPLIAAGLLFLAIGGYAAWRVYRLHCRSVEILNVNVANIRAADEVVSETERIRYLVRQGAATFEPRYAKRATELLVDLEPLTNKLTQLANSTDERQLAHRVERGRRESVIALHGLEHDRMYSTVASTLENVAEELIPDRIIAPAADYIAINEEQIRRSIADVERSSGQLITGLLLLGITGAIAGVATGYGMARFIGQRLLRLSLPLCDVAGQLNQTGGAIMVSMDRQADDLAGVLQRVAERVSEVVKQLQRSQRDALRAEQLAALGQLAAGLSHELRNPLMAIISILGESGHAADLDDRDIAVLREEALRLEGLVQSLLDFARPNNPQAQPLELCDLLPGVVHSVSARAKQRGVALVIERVPESAAAIADQGHVRQIVMNLLMNAIDATPKKGTIAVGASMSGRSVEITIRDEGVGLGLSVSRRLAELNGGTLSASSSDQGAIFTLNLPSSAIATVPAREPIEA